MLGRGSGELEGDRAVVEPGGEQEEGMELLGRREEGRRTLVARSPGGELGGIREVLARRERESSPIFRNPRRLEERIRLRDVIREQSGSRDMVARGAEGELEEQELEGRPAKRARTDTGQVMLSMFVILHPDTISAVSSSPPSSSLTWRRPSGEVSRNRRSPA